MVTAHSLDEMRGANDERTKAYISVRWSEVEEAGNEADRQGVRMEIRLKWLRNLVFRGMTQNGVPNEIRTRVSAVKGRHPRPLDDGDFFGAPLPNPANP